MFQFKLRMSFVKKLVSVFADSAVRDTLCPAARAQLSLRGDNAAAAWGTGAANRATSLCCCPDVCAGAAAGTDKGILSGPTGASTREKGFVKVIHSWDG